MYPKQGVQSQALDKTDGQHLAALANLDAFTMCPALMHWFSRLHMAEGPGYASFVEMLSLATASCRQNACMMCTDEFKLHACCMSSRCALARGLSAWCYQEQHNTQDTEGPKRSWWRIV
jgi:hypothetical protein